MEWKGNWEKENYSEDDWTKPHNAVSKCMIYTPPPQKKKMCTYMIEKKFDTPQENEWCHMALPIPTPGLAIGWKILTYAIRV